MSTQKAAQAGANRGRASTTFRTFFQVTALVSASLAAIVAGGCSSADQSVALIGGERVDASLVDRDPLALLPRGPVLLGYLDARAMFSTGFGTDVEQLLVTLLPLGPESNFVPSRDIAKAYGGVYAMQGADYCAVLQGNFDVEAIRRAAETRAVTPAGVPLVKSRYADNDLFTAGNIGFVVLTSHTVLTGNETGMRRALDRLRFGKLERNIPIWVASLLETRGASFALAGDLSSQPAVETAAQKLPFITGLRLIRVIGNFQPPGINFAGSLTYADPQSAANGAVALRNLQQAAQFMSMLSSWGFGGTVPPMQVATNTNDVAFTVPLDDTLVRLLLRTAADASRNRAYGTSSGGSGWGFPLFGPSR